MYSVTWESLNPIYSLGRYKWKRSDFCVYDMVFLVETVREAISDLVDQSDNLHFQGCFTCSGKY